MTSKLRHFPGPAALLASSLMLVCAPAAAAQRHIPFPTDPMEIGRHCLAVAATAQAAGRHFTNSTRAAPMAAEAQALHKSVVINGGLPHAEVEKWNTDAEAGQARVTEMFDRIGQPERGQYHSDRVFDELDQHVADCKSWLDNRPPMLAALPSDTESAADHCVVVAATARQLRAVKGASRAPAVRVADNAQEILLELRGSGHLKGRNVDQRLAGPKGDLYLAGLDVVLALKIIKPDTDFDPRSIKVIDDRLRQCHRAFGLQMPLR